MHLIINQSIKFNNNQMQVDKKESKVKYTYVTDQINNPITNIKKETSFCPACLSWQSKTQDLIWGYEDLLSAKQKQVQTLTNMINGLDEKLNKSHLKCENFNKKMQAYESQIQKNKLALVNYQSIISYYKQREAVLLSQLKSIENQLFTKNVIIKDDIDCKEEKEIGDIIDKTYKQNKAKIANTIKPNPSLLPIIQTSQKLGKMLQKNICEMQKMNQQKMMLQVKHRMAVLRAVQMSVLK